MKTIADHMLDIVQNSLRAGATLIEIMVEEDLMNDLYLLKITDDGCGMDSETLKKAADPFFTSRKTRKVGLGLALLKQNAEAARGKFQITSDEETGTIVEAIFRLSDMDRPPLGKIWEIYLLMLMCGKEKVDVRYRHKTSKGSFSISSDELNKEIGNEWQYQKEIRNAIEEMIKNNLTDIEVTF